MTTLSHRDAWQVIADAWRDEHGRSPTYKEALYTQSIALLETGYGRAGQFGKLAARGQYNWGAQQRARNADGSCPAGTTAGFDLRNVCFFYWPSDREAARAFVRTLTKRHWPTVAAMAGSAEDVARAMRVAPAYYEGYAGTEYERIAAYASAIRGRAAEIAKHVPATVAGARLLDRGMLERMGGALLATAVLYLGVHLWEAT